MSNSQKIFNGWMIKMWYVQTMEYYLAVKKKPTTGIPNNLDGSLENVLSEKNPISKAYMI